MQKSSHIYIAGHNGLVGSALFRCLTAKGYTNLLKRTHAQLDLMRQEKVEEFFKKERPEYVFLAAAKVGGILANNNYPADFIYSNLIIQTNVIHAAYRFQAKKLLFLGSSCIYPKYAPQPMKEEYLLTGELEPTNEPYALAKIAGIKMCQAYNRQYGTNYIAVMPTNLYGPNDNFNIETSHVLPALIRKFHLAKLAEEGKGESIQKDLLRFGPVPAYFLASLKAIAESEGHSLGFLTPESSVLAPDSLLLGPEFPVTYAQSSSPSVSLWGTGSSYREFLHVDDLAEACVFLMQYYNGSEIINIGSGQDMSIKELALLIKEVVGFKGELIWDATKPDGMPRKLLEISKLKSLGWSAKITLKEGLRRTYEWYMAR